MPNNSLEEIDELKDFGISVDNRLYISDLAHLVSPITRPRTSHPNHQWDKGRSGQPADGIGPAYADKMLRSGIRIGDLIDWENFETKFRGNFANKKKMIEVMFGAQFDLDEKEILGRYRVIRERLLPYIMDTGCYLFEESRKGKQLLFEGAQGTFLDIDHGTYPFVTSSNTISGCACVGSGLGPSSIDHVIGIVKAYTTRVGNGPFPTELNDSLGAMLREEGGEYGATTGRPRRCGWFDSVILRKSIQLNGLTRLAITKLDVFNKLDEIKICTHYEINGKRVDQFPSSLALLEKASPVYESIKGWKSDISQCTSIDSLPEDAMNYIRRLQELCYNIPALILSVGPDRTQTIEVSPL